MSRTLLSTLLLLFVASLLPQSTVALTNDCSLRSLLLSGVDGPIAFSPDFSRFVTTGYEATVPYDTDYVYLTAYSYATGPGIYIQYFQSGPDNNYKQVGVSVLSGQQSQPINLLPGINLVNITETCNCMMTYQITIIREAMSYTKGDPLFAGLLGQQFQVHGVADEIYSIVSDPVMQMNSRFVFLNSGDCPILNGERAAACWSHPGSYLGELGIKTCGGDMVHIRSGKADKGFAEVSLNENPIDFDEIYPLHCNRGAGANLGGNEDNPDATPAFWFVRNSTHLVTMQISNFLFQIENSDMFVNYRVKVLNWKGLPGTHGLLGQTYQKPAKPSKQIKEIEGNVDDYQMEDRSLWSDKFVFNRFSMTVPDTAKATIFGDVDMPSIPSIPKISTLVNPKNPVTTVVSAVVSAAEAALQEEDAAEEAAAAVIEAGRNAVAGAAGAAGDAEEEETEVDIPDTIPAPPVLTPKTTTAPVKEEVVTASIQSKRGRSKPVKQLKE